MSSSNANYDYDLAVLAQDGKELPNGEHLVVCPLCKLRKAAEEPGRIYDKMKLYIDREYQVGFCFVCNTAFHDKTGRSKMLAKVQWKPLEIKSWKFIDIPYLRKDQHNKEASEYLVNRCPQLYSGVDLSSMGFYSSTGKIVIKFMLNDSNYYYQLRYLHPEKDNNGQRYYSPVPGDCGKPLYIAGGKYDPYKPTVLVEGVFTALTEKLVLGDDYNVLAVLGHYLTEFQTDMLKYLGCFNSLYIHMDETVLSTHLLKGLDRNLRKARIIKNYSDVLDSEELIRQNKISVGDYREYLLKEMKPRSGLRLRNRFNIPVSQLS